MIAATGTTPAALAAKAATTTIPIVFMVGVDPVALGLVASLNRPGGNLTGVTILTVELGPKRLELLHELVPTATTIALLVNPSRSQLCRAPLQELQAAARSLGLQLHVLNASTERDFDTAFATLVQLRAGGLVIGPMHFSPAGANSSPHWRFATRCRRSSNIREFAAAGGLMSYGGSLADAYRLSRRLHWPHSQGREARRPAGPAGHQIRADHQPQDRQGARPHRAADAARPRRRGDRMREGASKAGAISRCKSGPGKA